MKHYKLNPNLYRLLFGLLALYVWVFTQAFKTSKKTEARTEVLNTAETHSKFPYRNMKNQAFESGEVLKYRVHYGIINAAHITMKVQSSDEVFDRPNEIKGRKAFHMIAEGNTLKAFDWAFKVRDRFESWVDMESMCPLKYTKQVQENNYRDHDLVFFRHISGKLNGKKGALDMESYTQDIVSALYYARNLDYENAQVGDSFPISVYLDNEIYNLDFKYMGTEVLKTDLGKVKCYILAPRLVVDRVFRTEEDMMVWISADKNKIPIRVKTDIKVGSLKVDITSYEGLKNPFEAKIK